jgi:hypothetical protein
MLAFTVTTRAWRSQQLLPPPPRTYRTSSFQKTNPYTSSETTNSLRLGPRICANRQAAQPQSHTDPRRRHRLPTRLSHRPQNLRRCRCTREATPTGSFGSSQTPRVPAVPPNGVDLGGIYEPAMPVSLNQLPLRYRHRRRRPATRQHNHVRCRRAHARPHLARERVVRPAAPCFGCGSSNGPGSAGMYARLKRPPHSTRS